MSNNYAALCSEKTLQSDTKGFFMQFVDHVIESAGNEWVLNIFGKLNNDSERIRIMYTDPKVKDVVLKTLDCVQEIYRKKSGEVCVARRIEAENLSETNQKLKSLIMYSQSVIRAPPNNTNAFLENGKSLVYSLWGRANVLIDLSEYTLALNDIQHVIKLGIPDEYKGHVYWKMAICYKGIGDDNKSKVSYGLAQKLLEDKPKLLHYLNEDISKEYREEAKNCRKVVPSIEGKKNKKLPNASKKLCVRDADELGRYIVTKEPIKAGETLVVEDPYVACLLPDCFGTHCHHCFERLIAPIGCSDCSNVAFCKIECRDVALSTYHKYECKYLELLIGSGMSILSHAALRLITQNRLENVLEAYKNNGKEKIFRLCTNSEKRTAHDFLQRTLMACFLLRCLQKSGYFVLPKTEDEYHIGELLLFYLQALQFNAHEIYETIYNSECRFKNDKASHIGVALYPTVSLFNHDCYPSVVRHFVGKKIVITSIRPFGSGEIVPENYGTMFTYKTLIQRQGILSGRYWFNCKCLACKLDWPTYDKGLGKVSKRIRCPSKGCIYIFSMPLSRENLKCPKCKNDVNLTDHIGILKNCEIQYEKAIELMENARVDAGIDVLCKSIDEFHRVSCPPHRETHLAQELLRTLLVDSGNVYDTFKRI